jgi:Skp family chaperone for outer membrane proteins
MKTLFVSIGSLMMAVAALVIAIGSRPAAPEYGPGSPDRGLRTAGTRLTAAGGADGHEAKLAALTARIEALEKEVHGQAQLKLLSDVSASLQSVAKRTDKNGEEVQATSRSLSALTRSTQEAMNQVASEIGRLNGQLAKLQETARRTEGAR